MKVIYFIFLLIAFIFIYLKACQHGMIYFPRSYDNQYYKAMFGHVHSIKYETSFGLQTFYLYPLDKKSLNKESFLWIVFGGNGSLALDWLEFAKKFPANDALFLLIDYPGYGENPGKAKPATIMESSGKAFEKFLVFNNLNRESLSGRIGVIGHSLGCAAALGFAEKENVAKIVLISPFTSLQDMACRVVGKPLCFLLKHDYDNRNFIKKIIEKNHSIRIEIIHGRKDEIIPMSMGRALKNNFSENIRLTEIPDGDHNSIIYGYSDLIYEKMLD